MNDPEFQKTYAEQNRREYIANATFGSMVSIPLNLSCSIMDHFMYPEWTWAFFKARMACGILTALVWFWFTRPGGRCPRRIFGVTWFMGPLMMIYWMMNVVNDPLSPYYAGLNIILLAMGLISPWTQRQNLLITLFVLAMYVIDSLAIGAPTPLKYVINNTTFLFLTAAFVMMSTTTSARRRRREFELRWELDQSRKVTEASLRQLQENELQLVQSEKLASLGRLSAGIIHEINNPLNFATTGLYTLRHKEKFLAPDQQAQYAEVLRDVEEGIDRVKTIVGELRTFSHPDTDQRAPVEVAEVVALALRFLSNEWRNRVQIETDIEPQLQLFMNQNKLVHVLVNLLQNSLDALKTKTFDQNKPAIHITGRTAAGCSRLSIRDNGPGIAPQHLGKIFDPFYTTKEVGEGMGLGLSICHRIVEQSGGKILVKTEPGRYCEFVLEFSAKT